MLQPLCCTVDTDCDGAGGSPGLCEIDAMTCVASVCTYTKQTDYDVRVLDSVLGVDFLSVQMLQAAIIERLNTGTHINSTPLNVLGDASCKLLGMYIKSYVQLLYDTSSTDSLLLFLGVLKHCKGKGMKYNLYML